MIFVQAVPVEIVVTGRGLEETAATPAYGSVTIERERLASTPSNRIEDALGDVAGLQAFRRSDSRSSNPSAQGLTLRALGGNATSRTLVLLDGVPVADPFFGYIPLSALAPERLASATVTRGAGSAAFGAGRVAGTIELTSAGADDRALLDGQFAAGSRAATEFAIGGAPRLGAGFVALDARWDRGDGFWTTPRNQRVAASVPAAYGSRSANVRFVTPLGDTNELQLHGLVFRDDRTLRFKGADSLSEGADASARLLHRGAWQIDAIAYVQRRNFANIVVSSTSFRPVLDQRRTPSTGVGGKLELRPPRAGALQLRFGGDLRIADGKAVEDVISAATGEVTATRTAGGRTSDLGLFAEGDVTFGKLLLTAGTRADAATIAGRSDWTLTGRGGALLDFGEISLRAAAYSGLRLPTLNELFRPFVVFPVTTEANENLRPEIVRGIEAGANWKPAPGTHVGVTIFANQLRHAIANVTIAPNLRRRDNVDAIRVYGIEADAAAKLGSFDLSASLALNDSRVRDDSSLDGRRPAQTPRFSGSATLGWSNATNRFAATLRHVAAQFEDDLNSDRLPAATTLGLIASHAVSPHVTLNARAENLFDERVVTRDQNGSIDLGQPRTLWIGFNLTGRRD